MNKAEYVALHQQVYKVRGDAVDFDCVRCGKGAKEWALKPGGDYASTEDYVPMCISCHRTVDQRAAHDRKQDHEFVEMSYKQGCHVCRLRMRRRRHAERMEQDQEYQEKVRDQWRVAKRRQRAQGAAEV